MTKHAVVSDTLEHHTGRYRADITRRHWVFEVQLTTRHTVLTTTVESQLEVPPVRPTLWWARWTARRMMDRAHRRDVRRQQPWTVD